jgi:hypothetical protein
VKEYLLARDLEVQLDRLWISLPQGSSVRVENYQPALPDRKIRNATHTPSSTWWVQTFDLPIWVVANVRGLQVNVRVTDLCEIRWDAPVVKRDPLMRAMSWLLGTAHSWLTSPLSAIRRLR